MTLDSEQTLIEIVNAMAARGIDPQQPFTEATFKPIAAMYGFPPETTYIARFTLNYAVALSNTEAKWTATNLPKVRKKLEAVEKHCRALQAALQDLDEEDFFAARYASIAQDFATDPELMGLFGESALEASPTITWDGTDAALERPFEAPLALNELSAWLEALNQALAVAQKVARKGKLGRREDATLDALIGCALQVYENFTGKRFSLQWNERNEAISEAARFCVDVVNVFDDTISPSKIVSASIQTRKNSIKVSDLEEVPDFVDHFSKRSR